MNRRLSIATLALVLAAYATALVWFTVHGRIDIDGRRFYVLGDDAMISMRYAYNLAHGRGLVWNPGEYVQGYTNLGWTLVMASVHAAGAPLPIAPLVVKLVNVGLHLAMIALVLARLPLFPGVVAAALIAFDSALLVWGLNGFEVTLEALLILLACWSLLDERWSDRWSPVWAALAYVVRPDALLVLAWVVLWQRRPRAHAPLLVAGALVAAVLVFQRAYYGDWLPNTFHLKASADIDRGLGYLERFALWEHFSLPYSSGRCSCGGYGSPDWSWPGRHTSLSSAEMPSSMGGSSQRSCRSPRHPAGLSSTDSCSRRPGSLRRVPSSFWPASSSTSGSPAIS